MKHISILIPKGNCSLISVEASQLLLLQVNSVLNDLGKGPAFTVQLVGINDKLFDNCIFNAKSDVFIEDVKATDLIIIPPIPIDEDSFSVNKNFISWIIGQYNNGAEVASFCIGSFFLASTGLLKNKECSTHWQMADIFKQMFPDVKLMDNKIITEAEGLYTSGGAFSHLHLLLYLIEKYVGREVAILISKIFVIEMNLNSQSQFIIFNGQKAHDDEIVKLAQAFIENNYHVRITTDQLSSLVNIGRRTFERRFKKATSNTVLEYIQRVKIEVVKKSIETTKMDIQQIMATVGYSDIKGFRTTFKKITGLSPLDYRRKYYKNS